jgi:hypothetical protein
MHFWIDIEVTKILGQFKQKNICKLIHDMQFQACFNPLMKILNYNFFFKYIIE